MRKVYSEHFIFRGVFCKYIREIPVKCEIRKVYSRPKNTQVHCFKILITNLVSPNLVQITII